MPRQDGYKDDQHINWRVDGTDGVAKGTISKAIKTGKLPYQAVAEEIESLLVEVEATALRSTLPERADAEWIDDFVAEVHRKEIVG